MARASLDKAPRDVAAMFDSVAKKYDLTNTVLSFGQDAWWRSRMRAAVDPRPGQRILDLAAGTAVSTEVLERSGAWCVACDFSLGMLQAGAHRGVPMVQGDAMHLPFADNAFDAVTISYGLRNVADPRDGLRELARVTKPGGRLVVNEFSRPVLPVFRTLYETYLFRVMPWVAQRVSSDPESYVYLAESIEAWPAQEELATIVRECGWTDVRVRNLTGGIAALHCATKPLTSAGE